MQPDAVEQRQQILKVDGLVTGYTDVPLIDGISIQLFADEIVALLGANGAGKTTIMRAIVGLLPAWRGRVLLDGDDVTALPTHERVALGLGMVAPGRALFSGLTVEDNLRMGCYLQWDRRTIRDRMAVVLELFPELVKRRGQLAGKLSGGEQQMVAIGRALMSRPRVLLVDELSLGLAPVVVERLMPTIERIRDELKIPMLFVEQDIARAVEVADRAYVLAQGKVVMEGHPRALSEDRHLIQAYLGLEDSAPA